MRARICFGVLFLLAPAQLHGQERPDLNGQWVLESVADAELGAARALVVRQFFEREKNAIGEPIDVPFVTISRLFQDQAESTTQRISEAWNAASGLSADGTVRGPGTRSALKWYGDRLVIESGRYEVSGSYSERDEEWSIDESGKLTITTTERASGDSPTTTKVTYRRQ